MTRRQQLPSAAFTVLEYLPGEDRPGEWLPPAGLANLLGELHGPHLASTTVRMLDMLRREGYAIRQRSAGRAYRRTPMGTTALNRRNGAAP